MWKLKNMLPNKEEIKLKIKVLKQMKMETRHTKTNGVQEKQFEEGSL